MTIKNCHFSLSINETNPSVVVDNIIKINPIMIEFFLPILEIDHPCKGVKRNPASSNALKHIETIEEFIFSL
jgi:hypothetical protein